MQRHIHLGLTASQIKPSMYRGIEKYISEEVVVVIVRCSNKAINMRNETRAITLTDTEHSMSKFSTKKFLKDREKSTQRSKSGELNLLKSPTKLEVAIEIIRKKLHTQHDLSEDCEYKLACGCRLSSNKRNKPECEGCL